MREILFFHGADCPHCKRMRPIVAKLKDELNVNITSLEVWDNEDNADKMREYADIISEAGEGDLGVPAFVDVKNNEAKTGEMTEEELKEWLMEK
jgi:thiol-disulfide isomerase/thioredoxin